MNTPFLTVYTPTYKRPKGLTKCLASVAAQTLAWDIEQIVIPDHVGVGVDGMFGAIPRYVDAVHGQYVLVLSDDEVLADPRAVEELRTFASANGWPECICANVDYEDYGVLPSEPQDPPVVMTIGLACMVTRNDVWKRLVREGAYGLCYEGDYDFALAAWTAGYRWRHHDRVLARAVTSWGKAEVA